jgi:hypothetical protein
MNRHTADPVGRLPKPTMMTMPHYGLGRRLRGGTGHGRHYGRMLYFAGVLGGLCRPTTP